MLPELIVLVLFLSNDGSGDNQHLTYSHALCAMNFITLSFYHNLTGHCLIFCNMVAHNNFTTCSLRDVMDGK